MADLDGDYVLVFKNPSALLSGAIAGAPERIDELRIFITNGGISQTVHRVDPWTYSSAPQIIDFNISDAEESSVVASITQGYVEFAVRAYLENGAVGSSLTYRLPISSQIETTTAIVRRLESPHGVDQSARDAAAAAQASADAADTKATANTNVIDRLAVFGQYELNPAGIPAGVPPDFIALTLSTKRVNKVIDRLQVNLGGVVMFDARRIARPIPPAIDPLAPFNFASNDYEGSGGVINLAFPNPADKTNFTNAASGTAAMRDQFVHGVITYTFLDGTVEADRIHFGVNNNAFRTTGNELSDAEIGEKAFNNPPATLASSIATRIRTLIGAGTGGGDTPASAQMVVDDRFVFVDTSAGNALKRTQSTLIQMIDRFRSGMAVVTSSAKGLMSSALFNKLTALPTRTELTAELAALTVDYNILVDDPTNPIAPTDDNADKILARGGRLYENVLHSAVDPVVTYRDFATSDLPGGFTWGGAHQVSPAASGVSPNTVIYSIPGAHFLRRVSAVAAYGGYSVPNWRGPASNKDEADERVTAVGDVVYYGGTVRVVTAFTAGSARYRTWDPIEATPADHSVTRDKLADALVATQAEMDAGTADKFPDAAKTKSYVDRAAGTPADGTITRAKFAQDAVDFVMAQNPILDSWTGEVDPTTRGFTRIASQTLASPYNSANDYWVIQNGASGNAVKAGLYYDNESLDYTKAIVNLDLHIERGGATNGSTGLLLGADTAAGLAWAGDASEGFGMWVNRLSDGRLFWLFRNNGLAAYLTGATAITAFNGAALGNDVVAGGAMVTPETGDRVLIQVASTGRYVYFYVNGTHYFTADLPTTWIAEYPNFGPRIAVVGDNGSIAKEVRLYRMSIGTPDPFDLSPDSIPKEVPPIPTTAGDYVIRRASGGGRSWVAPTSSGLNQAQVDARVALKVINGYATAGGGTTLRLSRADGTGNVDIPLSRVVSDVTILNAAQASRAAADRGKVLAVSASNENELALIAATAGGDSVIINDQAGTVAPNASNRDRIRYHDRKFYYNEPIHYTDPTVTYRALASSDLTMGYTLGGVFQVTPNLSSLADNTVWYSTSGSTGSVRQP